MRQLACRNELAIAAFASASLVEPKRPPELEVKPCVRCHKEAGIAAGELALARECPIATDTGVDYARQQIMRVMLGMSTQGFGDIGEQPPEQPPEEP